MFYISTIVTAKKQTKPYKLQKAVRKNVKHVFVPHKGNNYHPHLLRWKGITAVLALAVVIQLTYGFLTSGTLEVLGRTSNITVSGLVSDTNAARKQAGLPDLQVNEKLNQAAFLKANDMLAHNYWAHVSPSGVTPWKWLTDVGYNYDSAGENLAKNFPDAQSTVDAWMASPTHRANVLGNTYKDVGFAVAEGVLNGRDTTLIVAFYGVAASPGVAVTMPSVMYAAPINNSINNPLAYFGSAIQSLSPATFAILALLAVVGSVSVAAHHFRRRLPKAWRKSWRLHHGAYMFMSVLILATVIIFATGGGQV